MASLLLFNSFILGDQNVIGSSNPISFGYEYHWRYTGSSWLTNIFNKRTRKSHQGAFINLYLDIDPTLDLQKCSADTGQYPGGLKLS